MSFTRFLAAVDSYLQRRGYRLEFHHANARQAAMLHNAHMQAENAARVAELLIARGDAGTPMVPPIRPEAA